MFRFERLAAGGGEVTDGGIVLDVVVVGVIEDTDIVASNDIRAVTLVAHCKLRVAVAR